MQKKIQIKIKRSISKRKLSTVMIGRDARCQSEIRSLARNCLRGFAYSRIAFCLNLPQATGLPRYKNLKRRKERAKRKDKEASLSKCWSLFLASVSKQMSHMLFARKKYVKYSTIHAVLSRIFKRVK